MFDLSQISTYLMPSVVILCLCVGYVVKNLIPSDSVNRFIPLIVAVVGLVAGVGSAIATGAGVSLDLIVGSIVSGLASSGLYDGFKNIIAGTSTSSTSEEE